MFNNVMKCVLVFREFQAWSMSQLGQGGDFGTRLEKGVSCLDFL